MSRAAILLLVAALACAADLAAPLTPLARGAPLAPVQADQRELPPEERLLRDLDQAAHERDEGIQTILRASGGIRPVAATDLGPGLERPRAERDQALGDLRAAMDEYLGRTHRGDSDPLDQAGAARQQVQLPPLSAANRLAVAECFQQLASEEAAADRPQRLEQGLAEVEALPPDMPDDLRPRALYLKTWFLAESARATKDAAIRSDLAAKAVAAAAEFLSSFPDSELAAAVAALVADLKEPS